MSVQLIGWAYAQQTGSLTRKAVLLSLANAANHHTGKCNPSVKRICAEVEAGPTAVKNALAALTDLGLIARERTRRADGSLGTYQYRFPHIVPADDLETPDDQPGTPNGQPGTLGGSRPGTPGVSQEPEVLNQKKLLAPAARNGHQNRARNEIWDALTHMFGDATTRSAQTKRGKCVRELCEAGATHEEILARGKRWPLHFDNATLTETALVNHWDRLGRKPLRAGR